MSSDILLADRTQHRKKSKKRYRIKKKEKKMQFITLRISVVFSYRDVCR